MEINAHEIKKGDKFIMFSGGENREYRIDRIKDGKIHAKVINMKKALADNVGERKRKKTGRKVNIVILGLEGGREWLMKFVKSWVNE